MPAEQSNSNDTQLEAPRLSNIQIFLYGTISAIIAVALTCGSALTFWQLGNLDRDSEYDTNAPKPNNINESALSARLLDYFNQNHIHPVRIEHKALKTYHYADEDSFFSWVRLYDKTGRVVSEGVAEIRGSSADLQINRFVGTKMIVEEPSFARELVPSYATTKLFKLTNRAEPLLSPNPNDSDLKQLFEQNEPTFENLKQLLNSETKINRVSYCHINDLWIADRPAFTEQSALPWKRYRQYLDLLDKIRCLSVSYGSENQRPIPTSGDEVWFQMWQSQTNEKNLAKWIVYTKDGCTPKYSVKQANTDFYRPKDKLHQWACTPISQHWYIVCGYRPAPLCSSDSDSRPSDGQLKTLLRNEKNKLAELNTMLSLDKTIQSVEPDYIRAWNSDKAPINKAVKTGVITAARHQQYFELLKSLDCRGVGSRIRTILTSIEFCPTNLSIACNASRVRRTAL